MGYAVCAFIVATIAVVGVREPFPMLGVGILLVLLFVAFLAFERRRTAWPRLAFALSGASALVGVWGIAAAMLSIIHGVG